MNTFYTLKNIYPAKLGTIPAVVQVHGNDIKKITPGKYIRIKEFLNDRWHFVFVTKYDKEYRHIFADR